MHKLYKSLVIITRLLYIQVRELIENARFYNWYFQTFGWMVET